MRVFILGPSLAGATELARSLGRLVSPPFVPDRTGSWACRIANLDLVVRLKDRRAWVYDALRDAAKDPQYAAEAEFLRTVEAFIFVADSQVERADANAGAIENLRDLLGRLGRDQGEIPMVFALNKQDLPTAASMNVLRDQLRWPQCDHVGTIATKGIGMLDVVATLARFARSLVP